MKRSIFFSLFCISLLFSCDKKEENSASEKNNSLIWAEDVTTIMPMETDTLWDKADFTNASNKINREQLFSSVKNAVLLGKLKAYSSFPSEELTVKQVEDKLVQWDTLNVEDPVSGEMKPTPIKNEVDFNRIPFVEFNETIEFDTLNYSLRKKISYLTLMVYKYTETGVVVGKQKLFDVKLN